MDFENSLRQQPHIKRIPKSQVYNFIAEEVTRVTGVIVTKSTKITETPDGLRHSCPRTGIIFLQKFEFSVISQNGVVLVPYYFCTLCGNLFIFSEFYD